jgi:hypothetical protein
MDRRDALKSLAALAGATGLSVTPVTTRESTDVSLVILKSREYLSREDCEQIKAAWTSAVVGTNLERVQVLVHDRQLEIEIVRGRG